MPGNGGVSEGGVRSEEWFFEDLEGFLRGRGSTISSKSRPYEESMVEGGTYYLVPSGLVNAWPVFCVPRKRRNEVRNDWQQ